MFLSVVFGLFHGLVFLPVVLALFGQSEDEAGASAAADADDAPDCKGGAKLSRQNSDIEDNAATAVNNNKTQS